MLKGNKKNLDWKFDLSVYISGKLIKSCLQQRLKIASSNTKSLEERTKAKTINCLKTYSQSIGEWSSSNFYRVVWLKNMWVGCHTLCFNKFWQPGCNIQRCSCSLWVFPWWRYSTTKKLHDHHSGASYLRIWFKCCKKKNYTNYSTIMIGET